MPLGKRTAQFAYLISQNRMLDLTKQPVFPSGEVVEEATNYVAFLILL